MSVVGDFADEDGACTTSRINSDPESTLDTASRPTVKLMQEIAVVAILSMAQFTTQVGVGQTIAILHIIGDDLSIDNASTLSWLMAGYSLTVGTFILPSGRFGDLFGYKKMYLIGLAWYAIFSLVAGLAVYSGSVLFIFARALQGIGPAICLPNALALLGSLYKTGLRKNMVFSIFGATAPLGSVAGTVFASLLAKAWWPWTFFVFALVLATTTVLAFLLLPAPPPKLAEVRTPRETLRRLDPLGAVTGVAGLVLMSFAANQAPVISWKDPSIGITIGMGLLVMLAFFYVETKITAHPLLPYKRLNSDIGLILGCVACGWACFGIFLYYIWQFFELLRGASPLLASAWYSTNGVSGFVAAVLTGIFLGRVGPPLAMVLAMLAFVVGTIFIGTAPVDQTYWAQSFLCLLIIPFGMDISFPAATIIISDGLPPDEQGIGASLVNTVVNYSISVGLGMAALVEVNVRSEGPEGLLRGYRGAWYTGIGLSGLGLVISIFFWVRSRKRARTYTCTSTMRDDKP